MNIGGLATPVSYFATAEVSNHVFKDINFIRLLESVDIKINLITHENDYFIYYDILHNSEKIGCFALDKFNYKVYITDKDEVQLGAVNSLSDLNMSKKKTDISAKISTATNIYENNGGCLRIVNVFCCS